MVHFFDDHVQVSVLVSVPRIIQRQRLASCRWSNVNPRIARITKGMLEDASPYMVDLLRSRQRSQRTAGTQYILVWGSLTLSYLVNRRNPHGSTGS